MLELLLNSVSVASLICEWENSACAKKRERCMLSFRSFLFAAATAMFEPEFLFRQFILRFLF
ncbi:hypothetical protein CJZ71_00110 [Bacillus subtilis]|nr:hypothetical protein BSR08_06330 [Bacillus subtilis]AYK57170.1 hypothetical protein D9C10_08270 [Bacillus subtilis subsp. subtilis]GAK81574.1 hypothetical protein BSMD_034900 [Bacillus subtilis Miyagi-4]ARI88468.1 hypothetical protein B7470_21660 [Bacillus subtilis]ASU98733.1 hypothetical protein CJZ70_10520 [Bacillus subtilis]